MFAVGRAGYLPPFFQKTNKAGVQKNILFIRGGAVTLLALLFVVMPSVESFYQILSQLTVLLYLIAYLLMFGAAIYLRYSMKDRKPRRTPAATAGADHTCNVRTHGVHEQVVAGVVLQTEVVGDTGRHGHGRYTGIADKRIDFLVLGKHQVEELHEEHATRRGDDEAMKPRKKIKIVCGCEELRSLVEAPTVMPSRMVTMSVKALLAVLARRVVTPHSRRRLPKNSMPSRGRPRHHEAGKEAYPRWGR